MCPGGAGEGLQQLWVIRSKQDRPAPSPSQAFDGWRGGAEYRGGGQAEGGGVRSQALGDLVARFIDSLDVLALEGQPDDPGEGRVLELSAPLKLRLHEGGVVVGRRCLEAGVARAERLNDDPPRLVAAPGPTGDLDQKLHRALRGAEVRDVQRLIGQQHGDERDAGHVVPLRDHLRADENVEIPGLPGVQDPPLGSTAGRDVTIQPRDPGSGEQLPQDRFDLLRPDAEALEWRSAAPITPIVDRSPKMAVMAGEGARCPMPREGDGTMRA